MTSPLTRPWRRLERKMTGRFTLAERAPILQVMKGAAAAIITWFVCFLIYPDQFPIFGAIAALLCVQESVDQSLTRGVERLVGVLLGVSVAMGAGILFGAQSWLFIAAIFVSMTVGWLLRMTSSSTNQIAITALLMIALGGLQIGYGFERLIETAIGAAIGIALNALVVAPVRTSPLDRAIGDLTHHTALALERLADALDAPRDAVWLDGMYEQAHALDSEREQVHAHLRRARESLRLNPRGVRYKQSLLEDDELFLKLQPIVTQVIGMARALYDLYDPDLVTDPSVVGLAEEMRRAAHDLDQLRDITAERGAEPEPPALTTPYTIPTPHPEHWMLIGSLMEDLRRVRGRITRDISG